MKKSIHVLSFTLILTLFFFGLIATGKPAYATGNNFDQSNVLDDLRSSTVEGQPFRLTDYAFKTGIKPELVQFVEYCYSFRDSMKEHYGLYLYVWNPGGVNFDTKGTANRVMMATDYDSDGAPSSYEYFTLQFCNKAEESSYKNLFYKFRVVDHKSADGKTIWERVNSVERRYDISGFELLTYGQNHATEYTVGGTYKYSGYAKGYGPDPNAESTLVCNVTDLTTVKLDVRQTTYRTGVSDKGVGWQHDLHTVYFGVPQTLLDQYGKLQKIKAEWNEYQTTAIGVTTHQDVYDLTYAARNIVRPANVYSLDGIPAWGTGYSTVSTSLDWVYNWLTSNSYNTWIPAKRWNQLPYVFKGTDVSREQLLDYINHYNASYHKGFITVGGRTLSADLFSDTVDEGRTRGYQVHNIDADDKFDLKTYDDTHNWWQKLMDFGFKAPETGGEYMNISPIFAVSANDLNKSDRDLSASLYVNMSDVSAFREYCRKLPSVGDKKEVPYLFRFAWTDYYSRTAYTEYIGDSGRSTVYEDGSYLAQETVFLDFDILELTFSKEGQYKVIPVVMNPIDVAGAITPQIEKEEIPWVVILQAILGLIILVLAVALLCKFISFIRGGNRR